MSGTKRKEYVTDPFISRSMLFICCVGAFRGQFPLVACALCRFTTVKQVRYTHSRGLMRAGTRQQVLIRRCSKRSPAAAVSSVAMAVRWQWMSAFGVYARAYIFRSAVHACVYISACRNAHAYIATSAHSTSLPEVAHPPRSVAPRSTRRLISCVTVVNIVEHVWVELDSRL